MILISSWSRLCPILWSQVLSREWRCSWSSADRRCSNYIWVIDSSIAYQGPSYIRDLTVISFNLTKAQLANVTRHWVWNEEPSKYCKILHIAYWDVFLYSLYFDLMFIEIVSWGYICCPTTVQLMACCPWGEIDVMILNLCWPSLAIHTCRYTGPSYVKRGVI